MAWSTSSCRSAWWCWSDWPARTRSSSWSSPGICTQEGRPRYEATVEASRLRLRPILMTSFAFILGVVPLVIASGAGAEMRRSLGTAVFSGMIGVTLFGIFLTPVFFYVIQGLSETAAFFATGQRRWLDLLRSAPGRLLCGAGDRIAAGARSRLDSRGLGRSARRLLPWDSRTACGLRCIARSAPDMRSRTRRWCSHDTPHGLAISVGGAT